VGRTGIWFLWQVLVPIVTIVAFWPVETYFARSASPFSATFGTGDLILFSSLLLFGAAVQTELQVGTEQLRGSRHWALAVGFVAILVYGIVRSHLLVDSMEIEGIPKAPLLQYAELSCVLALLAVSLSWYMTAKAEKETLSQRVGQTK
jgi:hypothetical protein